MNNYQSKISQKNLKKGIDRLVNKNGLRTEEYMLLSHR